MSKYRDHIAYTFFVGCVMALLVLVVGKCVVGVYKNNEIQEQWCIHGGYTWHCLENTCTNKGEVVSERPTQKAQPLAAPPPAQAGSGSAK